jgi:hypothetical protein
MWISRSLAAAGVAGACVALSACGSDRSPEAYCKAFYAKAAPIRQSYVDANKGADKNPVLALAMVLRAPGDFVSILDGMVDHAPDEIKSDTMEARDSLKSMQESMGKGITNPLGALAENLVNSLTSAGAFDRVDAYLNDHCPVSSALAQKYIKAAEQ